ncbi:MerR family transcriptional regulator [Quadrisphaera granulorum]|uniref:MerR family transcriptional regulator n=1 Tax=Quadrisphaera granulorum TaxID=317664 RepID=UPI001B85D78C|nr:MerR family transcriptional regulator [Quadrisphaera granulorum]
MTAPQDDDQQDGGDQTELLTVGRVAEVTGVSVRTLHHYDAVGLVRPSGRTSAGYRLYAADDVERLQTAVVYRRLGFSLDDVGALLDADGEQLVDHLRRQRDAVTARLQEDSDLLAAIEKALEATMTGTQLTPDEQRELFGDSFSEDYAAEAQDRWGQTEAWAQSQQRTSRYTQADWQQVKAEVDELNAAFADLLTAGEPADGEAAMDVAERHRLHVCERFYDMNHAMHRSVSQLYVDDSRFTATYEAVAPGLAQYVRDAAYANAARHGVSEGCTS